MRWVRQRPFYLKQFAYFLNKLKSMEEGEGSLLDNCMIVYGGAISDGSLHSHNNLPILLAGRAGGTLRPGRHVKLVKETPMTNLYVAMLDRWVSSPTAQVGWMMSSLGRTRSWRPPFLPFRPARGPASTATEKSLSVLWTRFTP